MIECPDCAGEGRAFAFVNGGQNITSHRSGFVKCALCSGAGQIDPLVIKRRAAGHAWYEQQRRDGDLMVDVAIRLGMKPSQVSAIRQGRLPIPV